MARSVVVTGGAGFIGSHLTERCVEEGYDVAVVDDLSIGDRRNLTGLEDEITLHEVDLRSEAIQSILSGVDWVFHQAAIPSVVRSFENPVESTSVNVVGTVNLLNSARQENVQRIVLASSSSVYGDRKDLPKTESMVPKPQSPYAASKLSCEWFAEIFSSRMELDVMGLRYFNVFGPRQNPNTDYAAVIPNFIQALLRNAQPVIYGDGQQSRDFTYVEDVVRANFLTMKKGQPGEIYNVGYNQQTTVDDLLEELGRITGQRKAPAYEPPRPGDVRHSRASSEKLRNDTGFEPKVTVKEGLKRTVEWFREHPERWSSSRNGG